MFTFGLSKERLHSKREYAALDRNFLAWLRTSVSLLGFGLGVEKFGVFIESLSRFSYDSFADLGVKCSYGSGSQSEGIVIMIIGALVGLLGFVQYLIRLKHMDSKTYATTYISGIMIMLSVVLTGLLFLMNLGRLL
ncbi:MAG: DUF202 domain-containing protein [Candidatus Magnetominusculus sp. LBB02]|nr:DUF202 domain-containing protein [Candidatus Magnetominusculus sp. LBB02]